MGQIIKVSVIECGLVQIIPGDFSFKLTTDNLSTTINLELIYQDSPSTTKNLC